MKGVDEVTTVEEVKAAAYGVWPGASYIDIVEMAGFRPRFTALRSDGIVIWRCEAETLVAMQQEVQRRLELKEQ